MAERDDIHAVFDHLRALMDGIDADLDPMAALAEQRVRIDRYSAVDPSCLEVVGTVAPVEGGVAGRRAEWLWSDGADLDARVLFLHGGGWITGSIDGYRALAARIAEAAGAAVLTLDYRLAPEHQFPAGLEDCLAAYQWVREHGPDGARPARATAIVGDSAGGNLTLTTLLLARDRQVALPDAAVAISAVTDGTASGESYRTRAEVDPIIAANLMDVLVPVYAPPGTEPTNPLISPLHAPLGGLPPLLVQVGDAEVLRDDSIAFAEAAEAAGVDVTLQVWAGLPHVFQLFTPYLPEARSAVSWIGAFLREHLGVGSA